MKKYLVFVFCVFLLSCKESDATKGQDPINKAGTNCATVAGTNGGSDWKYCMHRYADSSDDLLIYFHGLGGSENDWENGQLEQDMLKAWRLRGVKPPVVIALSFGDTWLLAERNASPVSGLLDYYFGVVWPALQKKLNGMTVDKTYLMGLSMGGFNAAQLYLKAPYLFARVALICPAMSTITPFATNNEIQQYINATNADPQLVAKTIQLAQAFFPTVTDWNKHSPNVLAGQKVTPSFPPLYVANGASDPYGFAYPNKIFAQKVEQMGAPVAWDFYNGGGHCAVNAESAAMALIPQ